MTNCEARGPQGYGGTNPVETLEFWFAQPSVIQTIKFLDIGSDGVLSKFALQRWNGAAWVTLKTVSAKSMETGFVITNCLRTRVPGLPIGLFASVQPRD